MAVSGYVAAALIRMPSKASAWRIDRDAVDTRHRTGPEPTAIAAVPLGRGSVLDVVSRVFHVLLGDGPYFRQVSGRFSALGSGVATPCKLPAGGVRIARPRISPVRSAESSGPTPHFLRPRDRAPPARRRLDWQRLPRLPYRAANAVTRALSAGETRPACFSDVMQARSLRARLISHFVESEIRRRAQPPAQGRYPNLVSDHHFECEDSSSSPSWPPSKRPKRGRPTMANGRRLSRKG